MALYRLQATEAQKTELVKIQKETDAQFEALLTDVRKNPYVVKNLT